MLSSIIIYLHLICIVFITICHDFLDFSSQDMDPASAAVAFVGFTASLVTLAGLALDSLQTLYRFQAKVKDAPEDILRLQDGLKRFEALLSEIGLQQNDGLSTLPQHLCELWGDSAMQMKKDLERFRDFLLGFERRVNQSSVSSKNLRARLKFFFREDAVDAFQRRLSMHVQFLHTVQSLLSL